jgi:hypothetical protein
MLSIVSPWKWRQYVPLKFQNTLVPHGLLNWNTITRLMNKCYENLKAHVNK